MGKYDRLGESLKAIINGHDNIITYNFNGRNLYTKTHFWKSIESNIWHMQSAI